MPFFSIIIPTYNRAYILPRALDSIKQQSFDDWECIIVDDSSTDNTIELINKYENEDKRFKYIKNTHKKGACGARNTGIDYATGKWIIFLDSDNSLFTMALTTIFNNIQQETKADIITWKSELINSLTEKSSGPLPWVCGNGHIHNEVFSCEYYIDTNAAAIKKQILDSIAGFDERCESFEEWDLHIRLSKTGLYHAINQPLNYYYTGNPDQLSLDELKHYNALMYIFHKYSAAWIENIDFYIKRRKVVFLCINKLCRYQKQIVSRCIYLMEKYEKDGIDNPNQYFDRSNSRIELLFSLSQKNNLLMTFKVACIMLSIKFSHHNI